MTTVLLNTGGTCNNGCVICSPGPARASFRGKALAPRYLQKMQENLSAGKRLGSKKVVVTGGEPLLNPYTFEAVRYARSIGYKEIVLRTNGRLFCYPDRVAEAVSAGVKRFEISLHGHTAALHDFVTRTPGSFLQTLGGIKNLVAAGQTVVCAAVVCRPNFRHLPDLVRLSLSAGAQGFRFCVVEAAESADALLALTPRQELAAPWLIKALDLAQEAGRSASVEGVPACLLGRHAHAAAVKAAPEELYVDPAFPAPPSPCAWLERSSAPLGPDCGGCRAAATCAGPPSAYTERFGWREFRPLPAESSQEDRSSAAR